MTGFYTILERVLVTGVCLCGAFWLVRRLRRSARAPSGGCSGCAHLDGCPTLRKPDGEGPGPRT